MQKNYLKFIIIIFFIIFPENIKCEISSPYAVLMEEKSGIVLYNRNMNVRRPIASTTKIMTAIITLEKGNLKDYVDISPRAKDRYKGESLVYLEFNEKITVEELLYALLLRSANDAAIALSEHIAGSVENFVCLMNKKAEEIGAKNTHFANPHGFYGGSHYSTCYDLALISRYALKNEKFNEIVKTKKKIISWGNNPYFRILVNRNKLLWKYKWCDGIKTGMTEQAGHCLVASATKNGMRLISVVLNSPKLWDDSVHLLEYGFNNYKKKILVKKGEVVKKMKFFWGSPNILNIVADDDFWILVRKNENSLTIEKKNYFYKINIPVKKGEILGKIIFINNKKKIGEVSLVAGEDIKINYFLRILTYLIIIVIIFIGLIKYVKYRRRKYYKVRRKYYGSSRLKY